MNIEGLDKIRPGESAQELAVRDFFIFSKVMHKPFRIGRHGIMGRLGTVALKAMHDQGSLLDMGFDNDHRPWFSWTDDQWVEVLKQFENLEKMKSLYFTIPKYLFSMERDRRRGIYARCGWIRSKDQGPSRDWVADDWEAPDAAKKIAKYLKEEGVKKPTHFIKNYAGVYYHARKHCLTALYNEMGWKIKIKGKRAKVQDLKWIQEYVQSRTDKKTTAYFVPKDVAKTLESEGIDIIAFVWACYFVGGLHQDHYSVDFSRKYSRSLKLQLMFSMTADQGRQLLILLAIDGYDHLVQTYPQIEMIYRQARVLHKIFPQECHPEVIQSLEHQSVVLIEDVFGYDQVG